MYIRAGSDDELQRCLLSDLGALQFHSKGEMTHSTRCSGVVTPDMFGPGIERRKLGITRSHIGKRVLRVSHKSGAWETSCRSLSLRAVLKQVDLG